MTKKDEHPSWTSVRESDKWQAYMADAAERMNAAADVCDSLLEELAEAVPPEYIAYAMDIGKHDERQNRQLRGSLLDEVDPPAPFPPNLWLALFAGDLIDARRAAQGLARFCIERLT